MLNIGWPGIALTVTSLPDGTVAYWSYLDRAEGFVLARNIANRELLGRIIG